MQLIGLSVYLQKALSLSWGQVNIKPATKPHNQHLIITSHQSLGQKQRLYYFLQFEIPPVFNKCNQENGRARVCVCGRNYSTVDIWMDTHSCGFYRLSYMFLLLKTVDPVSSWRNYSLDIMHAIQRLATNDNPLFIHPLCHSVWLSSQCLLLIGWALASIEL